MEVIMTLFQQLLSNKYGVVEFSSWGSPCDGCGVELELPHLREWPLGLLDRVDEVDYVKDDVVFAQAGEGVETFFVPADLSSTELAIWVDSICDAEGGIIVGRGPAMEMVCLILTDRRQKEGDEISFLVEDFLGWRKIGVLPDGRFDSLWPGGFFPERRRLLQGESL